MTLISSNKNRVNSFSRGLNRVLKTSSTKEAPKTHALTKDSFSKNDTLSKTSTPKINMGTHLSASNVKAGINVNRPQINHTKSKETEFDPRLTKNQKNAVIYSNKIAKENSQKARPELLQKIKKLGYSEKDLDKVLKYIREEAPLNINFSPDKKTRDNGNQIDAFINSKNYTAKGKRGKEDKLFSINSTLKRGYPKYGTLNPCLDHKSNAPRYGLCYFVLQKSLKKRTTFTHGNSHSRSNIGTAKHFEHIINKLGDGDIKNVMETGLGKPAHSAIKTTQYIEAQYHGPIEFSKDIEALIIDKKYENTPYEEKLRIFAKKNNISLKWKINSGLVLHDHSYKNNIKECDINPNSDSTNIIPKEKILFESTNITDNNSLQNLKNYNYILGALTIQNMDISTLKLPQLSYLRGEIAIKTTSGVNLSISKDLSSVKISHTLLNTPHEKKIRTFAKNNNLNIKVDYNRTLLDDKKEYKLSEFDPDIVPNSTSNKTILKENIRGSISIRASDITQLKEGDCILGGLNIQSASINTLKLPQLSYVRDGITIKTTSGVNVSISKDLSSVKISHTLLNTPHEKKIRTFAKNNNLNIKVDYNKTLLDDKKEYKLSELDPDILPNSTSNKTILKENIHAHIYIRNTSDIKQLKEGDCVLGHINIENTDISNLKLSQLSYVRDGINIKTTSGVNLSISKDLDSVEIPYNLLNTPHEKELRSFAKNNNLTVEVDYNGIILNDKKEYKLSELDPDTTSIKTILRENIQNKSISIRASDIAQLKKGDCILGSLSIQSAPINTLKLPQLSYVRDGITITTTSGINLSISKDFDTIKISHTLLNTPGEKEVRTFAKNNNLTIKWQHKDGTLIDDKSEYKLSEINPDSTSIKTILRENIQNKNISIRASDIAQLKTGDCILGSLSIQSVPINTFKLPQVSYVRDGITIKATSGANISISKDLSSVEIPHTLLNTPHEEEARTFAKNNNLTIKWQHKDGTLIDDKSEYKLSEIIPDSTSIKAILRENIQNKNISIRNASDVAQLKEGDCILGSLSIQSTDINTLKLPQLSYVRNGIAIKTTSGINLSISKDFDTIKISHTLLNTPHETEVRTFAKNNNLPIKIDYNGIILNDKKEYKLSELDPNTTSIKTILRENIQNKSISIRNASDVAQLKKGDCILGSLSIQSTDINTLKLPQLSYVRDGIAIKTTSGINLSISKDFDTIKIPYKLLNTPHEKEVRTFAKNNNLSIKWERQDGTLVESKSEYKLSELDPNTNSNKTILRENIQNKSISIRNTSDVAQLRKGDCILGSLSIHSTLINTLKLPQLSYVRDGIAITTTSGADLSISKDFDTIKIPYKLLNTPHEKEVRTFAKNNNLPIKWEGKDGTLIDDKEEYKLSELDPNTTSIKTILRENIQNKNISISASNIAQLKKGDCILGSLSIQSAPINTLKIPQLSYVRDGITIKTTSGINLSISKDFDTIKIPYNLLNTPHEKEVRTFAKNNNLPIKWEHKDGTLIDDKEEYKLSEINTDIKQGSTSDKTILKENIRGNISIRNASDIAQLKTGDCILGGLSIQGTDINTLILPKFSYIQDGITIKTKSGANLSISKDLDSVKMPYTLLNTLQGIEVRNFARNNDLSIKWEHEDGNLIESKSEYKLSELDPNSNSNKTILKENIRGSISIRNASDITKLKEEDCILGSLNIQNVPINTLKIPQVSYVRDGITITTTSGANLSISKNLDSVKIPDNLLNTPQETEVRTFAKNNNLPIKWQYKNGTLIDDKKEYKLSDLDPDSTSDKTISMKNIRGSISIRASDIVQLKKEDYILGSLSIQSASINTLKLPQLSYVRDGINIKITSGYNLFISKNLDTVHTPFNTSREKEIRDFAKNNNLTIKWQ